MTYLPQWLHYGEAFNLRFHSPLEERTGAKRNIHSLSQALQEHTQTQQDIYTNRNVMPIQTEGECAVCSVANNINNKTLQAIG